MTVGGDLGDELELAEPNQKPLEVGRYGESNGERRLDRSILLLAIFPMSRHTKETEL